MAKNPMIAAAIDGNGWAIIIAAVVTGVIQIMAAYRSGVKMDALAKVADDTHTLVNSNMGIQLKLGSDLSEFKAATTNNPDDIQSAVLARTMYEEHVKKQAIVDSK